MMVSECQDASANIVIFQFLLNFTRKEFTCNILVECSLNYCNVKLCMGILQIVRLTEFLAAEKKVECLLQNSSSTSICQAWTLNNIFKFKTFFRGSRHLVFWCHYVTVCMAQQWLFTALSVELYGCLSISLLLTSSHCSTKKVQFLCSLKLQTGLVFLSWAAFSKYFVF